jgi:hypothetical protein
VTADPDPTLLARLEFVELLAEAERRGLGMLVVDFIADPGREEEAASFIEQRADED